MTPTYEIITGDALVELPKMASGSVSAVIADPPYGINTKSDGTGKLNPWADLCNSAMWYAAWIKESRRTLRADGCLWSFMNWRSLTTFQKAACDSGWPIESLLVWNKEWIGPGGQKGLRPSYELVALWAGEAFAIENRGLPDIQNFKWCGHKPTGHPAEKPVDLCRWLLDTCPPGLVIDPFCGSGSTGVACLQAGRSFIGIEIDPVCADMARARCAAEAAQGKLFAGGAA